MKRLIVGILVSSVIAPGWADDLDDVRRRIRDSRMEKLVIEVVDKDGRPVEGVELKIEQRGAEAKLGCNIFMWGECPTPETEKAYRERFAQLFDYATVPFYWWSYEPERGRTNEKRIREIAAWCHERKIEPKGHPLLWNYAEPKWLPESAEQVKRLTLDRVMDCVVRYTARGGSARDGRVLPANVVIVGPTPPDPVRVWDVVNEASQFERFKDRSPKITGMWEAVGRVELVRAAFEGARRANPQATLLINDYDTSERYLELIKALRRPDGTYPFDVIGIQSHMHGGAWPSEKIRAVCERFAQFGLPLHFTEMTILSGQPGWQRPQPWPSTPEGEARQAEELERVYLELLAQPAVEAITWWDLSDRGAWQGAPAGLLRADMTPKPAYEVLKRLKETVCRSRVTGKTGPDGRFECHVYRDDYAITFAHGRITGGLSQTVAKQPRTSSAGPPSPVGRPVEIRIELSD